MSEKFNDDHKIETYKSMISISVEGFKILALLNGGAAAGLLAAFDKIRVAVDAQALKRSIICFVIGLTCVGFAFTFSYLTQNTLFEELLARKPQNSHTKLYRLALCFCLLSLGAFALGALIAAFGIR